MNLHITITKADGTSHTKHARNTAANRATFISQAKLLITAPSITRARVWYERKGVAQTEWDSALDAK